MGINEIIQSIVKSFNTSLMITIFVLVMMLLIEYFNVITKETWQKGLSKNKWIQYLVAVLLGALPGCMGAFAVVAMFSHRVVSFGALVAAMIATSGDEAFVMFAIIPEQAFILTGLLIVVAIFVGWLTDITVSKRVESKIGSCSDLEFHEHEECECFQKNIIYQQWKNLTLSRGLMSLFLLMFILSIVVGSIGPQIWGWKRITLIIVGVVGLFIISTVPDHFLKEHLWKHIFLKHIPSIFLWTFLALIVTHFITSQVHVEGFIEDNVLYIILFACILGIIPESGPHLVFVTLYAQGTVPFAVLAASSIVQDGHGMLPMLAQSRKGFLLVKGINFIVGLAIGLIFYFGKWL
ncbi:MAG: putative manganese transporter [candidate division Zixibacteria bacterium]|nr:putative manganese transporter [candidate division Zixibacteria bacterium]